MSSNPSMQVKPAALKWFNQILTDAQAQIYAHAVSITPDKAAAILSRNPDNRNIRESKVSQYEADMREGRFRFNGESIIISKDGLLNDGQHRLLASVRAGKPFTTMLVVGVERESRDTIDIGAAKSAGDHLSFNKVSNATTCAAMARFIICWERDGNLNRRSYVTVAQQMNRVMKDEMLREMAAWVDTYRHRMRNILRGSLVGMLFYMFAKQSPLYAKQFMDSLRDGANLTAGTPIHLLREKLLVESRLTDMQRIEATIRAWNHWLKGTENMARLTINGNVPAIDSLPSARRQTANAVPA